MAVATENGIAKPFLKWAGGKGQLKSEIEARLPSELREGRMRTYVEPFVGGGAIFFYLAQRHPCIEYFYLYDINQDLVECYNAIKNSVEPLICVLGGYQDEFLALEEEGQKEYFYEKRVEFNLEKKGDYGVDTVAKLLFLNRTCFNGLYRVNKKNEFNVPFGRYKNPTICAKEKLRSASNVLQKAEVFCDDFTTSAQHIDENTFVYFDPPYRPLSATANFTSYSKDRFTDADQIKLAEYCKLVDRKGAKLLLSNSDPKNEDPNDQFFEDNYRKEDGFEIDRVKAKRAINCKASGRGQINELLITNY